MKTKLYSLLKSYIYVPLAPIFVSQTNSNNSVVYIVLYLFSFCVIPTPPPSQRKMGGQGSCASHTPQKCVLRTLALIIALATTSLPW